MPAVDEEDPLLHVTDPLLGSASIYDLNTWEELKDLLNSGRSPTAKKLATSPFKPIQSEEWSLDEFLLQEEDEVLFEKEDQECPKTFKKSRKERLVARRRDEAGVQILIQGGSEHHNKENIYFCSSENFILRPMTTNSYSCNVRSPSTVSASRKDEGSLPRRRTVNILKRQLKSQEKKEIKDWAFLESGTWAQIEEAYYSKSS